jgi:hypothetical protein
MMRLSLLLIAPLLAAQPRIQNAQVETRAVSGPLETAVNTIVAAQPGPAWIAYAVPQNSGVRNANSWTECGTIRLEGASEYLIFYRIESKQVERIRTFPADCGVDAGGLPVFWLTGVDATESVGLLKSLIPKFPNQALSAMALHRDGVIALADIARNGSDNRSRKQALSLLGKSKDSRATKFFEDIFATR